LSLDERQVDLFSRQILLREVGGKGQERLLASRVLVLGSGPAAETAATYLAGAGVGTLGVEDAGGASGSEIAFAPLAERCPDARLVQLDASGRPDFALLDWNMPEMNGFELLVALRADPRYLDLPVVMVTTETEMAQIARALECGANEYVMKPFTPDILRDKLDMLGLVPAGY